MANVDRARVLMFVNKEKLTDIGFRKDKILVQIGIGIILAIAMSLVLTVVPILLGFKDMVGSIKYTETWKFVYQFIYAITGVALAEEIVFRGYIFSKLLEIKNQGGLQLLYRHYCLACFTYSTEI